MIIRTVWGWVSTKSMKTVARAAIVRNGLLEEAKPTAAAAEQYRDEGKRHKAFQPGRRASVLCR